MTQHVIAAIRDRVDETLGQWRLTIYDDNLNEIFERVVKDIKC